MLLESEYNRAFKLAREDAASIIRDFIKSDLFFQQDDKDRAGYARVISRLAHFAHRNFGVIIHQFDYEDVPGFASWLVRSGNGTGGIALYRTQMAKWAAKTKMPLHVQMIRSIIHEFGHLRLSPHILMDTLLPRKGAKHQIAPHASPLEEELAWVYACSLLGIMLGDYSFHSRKYRVDDAPRLFL